MKTYSGLDSEAVDNYIMKEIPEPVTREYLIDICDDLREAIDYLDHAAYYASCGKLTHFHEHINGILKETNSLLADVATEISFYGEGDK